jgi:hypothetical protein
MAIKLNKQHSTTQKNSSTKEIDDEQRKTEIQVSLWRLQESASMRSSLGREQGRTIQTL